VVEHIEHTRLCVVIEHILVRGRILVSEHGTNHTRYQKGKFFYKVQNSCFLEKGEKYFSQPLTL
jgi:hypothetical protein